MIQSLASFVMMAVVPQSTVTCFESVLKYLVCVAQVNGMVAVKMVVIHMVLIKFVLPLG